MRNFCKTPSRTQPFGKQSTKIEQSCFHLIDASRVCYLKQVKELENYDFQPLKTDPALFIYKPKAQTMCEVAGTVHVKDLLVAGKKNIMENSQHKIQENLGLDPRDDLPRFLGLNYKRGQQGELIVVCQHYTDSMEIPDLNQLAGQTKKKVLSQNQQSIFKSLTSKLNEFAQTIRPDTMYAAKYLSTKYGRATKSDMTQVVKLVRKSRKFRITL